MTNRFIFFQNFAETIRETFDTPKEQAAAYMAVCKYHLYGILPEDKTMKAICLINEIQANPFDNIKIQEREE